MLAAQRAVITDGVDLAAVLRDDVLANTPSFSEMPARQPNGAGFRQTKSAALRPTRTGRRSTSSWALGTSGRQSLECRPSRCVKKCGAVSR